MNILAVLSIMMIVCVFAVGAINLNLENTEVETQNTEESVLSIKGNINQNRDEYASKNNTLIKEVAHYMVKNYGPHIQEIRGRANLLQYKNHLLEEIGSDGESIFYEALYMAFPELAFSIEELLKKFDHYLAWLDSERMFLNELRYAEKQNIIWEKRYEIFGRDADTLWSHERTELAQNKTKMRNAIEEIDASKYSLNEKLYQFQSYFNDLFKSNLSADNTNDNASIGVAAQAFLSLDSVQHELGLLSKTERAEKLREIRTQLGYNTIQIEKLSRDDAYRNARWDRGLAYMEERRRLVSTIDGEMLENALFDLRNRYFMYEAETIESEEATGFFRYERPRIYGRN